MQRHYEDDPSLLGPILQVRLDELEKHLNQRFDDVQADIARIQGQIDGLDALERRRCEQIEIQLSRHGERIAAQERQNWLRWAATAISAFLAVLGIRTPE